MPYATQTDLEVAAGGAERFVQLADWDGDGVADEAVIAYAIAAADSFVDSFGAIAGQTPIDPVTSPILASVAADEAVYLIREKRGLMSERDIAAREKRIEWLTLWRKGTVRPTGSAETDRATANKSAWVASTADNSREGTKGFW